MNTQLYFNNQLAYFDKEETIAASYALNKSGDLKTRQGTATNTYSLPFVKQNKAIFSDAELIANEGAGPYTKYTHEVIIEGISVFKGSAFVAESFDGYKIQAVSDNSDFYLLLKNDTIQDLDFTDIDHTRDDATVISSWPNTSGYIYPFIDYGKYQDVQSQSIGSDDSNNVVTPADLFPAVYLKTLLQKVSDFTGYIFTGSVFGNARLLDEIIPFTDFPFKPEDNEGKFEGIKTALAVAAGQDITIINLTVVDDPGSHYDGFGFFTNMYAKYVKVSIDADVGGYARTIAVTKRTATSLSNAPAESGFDTTIVYTQQTAKVEKTIFVTPGERIFVTVDNLVPGSGGAGPTGSIRINSFTIETVEVDQGYGLPWSFAKNLPAIKLDKFILDFMNRYGLSIYTDTELKIVNFFYEDDILLKQPIDWSGKIDNSVKQDLFYRFDDYTQKNRLSYLTSDVLPDGFEYDFLIDDETLSEEINDEYTSVFSLAPIGSAFQGSVQTININTFAIKAPFVFKGVWESPGSQYLENDVVSYENDLFKAVADHPGEPFPTNDHWEAAKQADIWTIAKGTPVITRANRMPSGPVGPDTQEIKVFAINTAMTWPEIWAANYNALKRILVNTKITEINLRLNYSDIAQLDLTAPHWLSELGLIFKIDEVKQFKFNEVDSTIVRLIRL